MCAMPAEQAPRAAHLDRSYGAVAAPLAAREEDVVLHAGGVGVVEHADLLTALGPDPSPAAAELGAAVVAGVHLEEEEPKPVLFGVDRKQEPLHGASKTQNGPTD